MGKYRFWRCPFPGCIRLHSISEHFGSFCLCWIIRSLLGVDELLQLGINGLGFPRNLISYTSACGEPPEYEALQHRSILQLRTGHTCKASPMKRPHTCEYVLPTLSNLMPCRKVKLRFPAQKHTKSNHELELRTKANATPPTCTSEVEALNPITYIPARP